MASRTSKTASADPGSDQPNATPDPDAQASTQDQPTPGDATDAAEPDRAEQAEKALSTKPKAGPTPGSDEYFEEYRDTFHQLSKTADLVPAPEGTTEHFAYAPPKEK